MNTMTINAPQPVSKGYRVDISRGENIGRVSSEWFSRPDDERYLSLTELYDAVKSRADRAKARTVESRAVRVEALYTRSNLTDDAITAGGGLPDQKWTSGVFYAGVAAPYYISGRAGTVRPYVIGGLGLYSQTVKFEDTSGVTQSTTESGFGFNGGAGIRFGRAMGFFVEARFHQFSITPDGGEKSTGQFIPVSFGFTF